MTDDRINTVVIGGSQAGLAVGYHLRLRRVPYVVLDQNARIGDAWRNRWDSLRLFTPGRYNALPGLPFPGPAWTCPTKDEAADYLEAYARHFDLPVRTGVRVDRLSAADGGFEIRCGEEALTAANVVVATGAYHHPRIPPFAAALDPAIRQFHSSVYRNPSQLRDGSVLVIGAGNSGAEIAVEIAGRHRTWLSGPDTGQEPTRAGSLPDRLFTPIMWLAATRLTVETWPGRKLRSRFLDPPRGIPLGRVRRKQIAAAGIERVGRTVGIEGGCPVLEDGRVLQVSNVIWCTGYTPDFSWIDLPIPARYGYPDQSRGIVAAVPGLYFVGLPFLYSISSALLGGVGRDAAHIAEHIVSSNRRP